VTPPTGLLDKGTGIEEWIDLRFFRPLGLLVVRALARTRASADQVTLAAMLVGLAAGHLFFYRSVALNSLGLALFILSEVLDSADGQLARLRGSSTKFGAILDGISDNVRFANLYGHLLARALLVPGREPLLLVALALAAVASHILQASVSDFLRQVYLLVTTGDARLDLPEDLAAEAPTTLRARVVLALYRPYVARQARWCPSSAAVVRLVREGGAPSTLAAAWGRVQRPALRSCALIGQNIRLGLLAATALPGWPAGLFWLTLGPLNQALVGILLTHERHAARLARLAVPADLAPAGSAG
jgi:phosphatidylglycerophosphate synthase